MTMVKSQLIESLSASKTEIPKKFIASGVDNLIEILTEALVDGRRIEIRGFGSFSIHERAPRKARNPKTGETVFTDTNRRPHFKPGNLLKERVDQSKDQTPISEDE